MRGLVPLIAIALMLQSVAFAHPNQRQPQSAPPARMQARPPANHGSPPPAQRFAPYAQSVQPVPEPAERRSQISAGDAAHRAQEANGGGRVLAVDPMQQGYRVKLLKDGEVRAVQVPPERR